MKTNRTAIRNAAIYNCHDLGATKAILSTDGGRRREGIIDAARLSPPELPTLKGEEEAGTLLERQARDISGSYA